MPCDYAKYPKNWKWLSGQIVARGHGRCELCHVANGLNYWRNTDGEPWAHEMPGYKKVKIVLTVHHINADVKDNREYNLISLCQRCHNKLDMPWRVKNRKSRSEGNGGK
jgi:hypothetical protein